MFSLIYDATSLFFFNAINEYSFNNIIIDYNLEIILYDLELLKIIL